MSLQKGAAIVWSLVTAVSGTGIGAGIVDSVEYEISPVSDEMTHGLDGKVKNRTFADTLERVTINVIPSSTTLALAKAANIVPAIGADVTVADADDAEIAGTGSGDGTGTYHVVSARKSKTAKGKASISMTIERFETHLATAT